MPAYPPAPTGAAYATTPEALLVVRPLIPTNEGIQIPTRLLAVQVAQGQAVTIGWTFRNTTGQVIQLSEAAEGSSSSSTPSSSSANNQDSLVGEVRIAEAISRTPVYSAETTITNGELQFEIPVEATSKPGVLQIEARLQHNGRPVANNTFFAYVDRSLFAESHARIGVPTIADVRAAVRDTSPNDNYLLKRLEWVTGEIAEAAVRSVALWNMSYTAVGPRYTTQSFVYPDELMFGMLGYLYTQAGLHYERNDMSYAAAGVSVDDTKKASTYLQLGKMYDDKYKVWIQQQKITISRAGFFGLTSSPYARTGWWARPG